jgi:hypothetical protein
MFWYQRYIPDLAFVAHRLCEAWRSKVAILYLPDRDWAEE